MEAFILLVISFDCIFKEVEVKNRIIISASIAVCAFMLLLSVNRFFTFYGFSVSGKCQYESKDGRIITSENFTKSDLNRIVKILNFHIIDYGNQNLRCFLQNM